MQADQDPLSPELSLGRGDGEDTLPVHDESNYLSGGEDFICDLDADVVADDHQQRPDAVSMQSEPERLHAPLQDGDLFGGVGLPGESQVHEGDILLADEEKEYLAQFDALLEPEDDHFSDLLSTWETVADRPVCEDLPDFTVRQAAFGILHTIHSQHTTFKSAQQFIYLTCCGLLKSKGQPSPTNPGNRFPTSLAVCYKVTGVPNIDAFEVHLCPSDSECMHAFRQKMDDPEAHVRSCSGCKECQCPRCGTPRFVRERGTLRPGFMLYFFHDVLQQFFLNREWWTLFQREQGARTSSWLKTKECQDLMHWFDSRGVDRSMVRNGYSP
jgi:hypothetical protein